MKYVQHHSNQENYLKLQRDATSDSVEWLKI